MPTGGVIWNAGNVGADATMCRWREIYCVVRGVFCCRNGTNADTLQGESRLFGVLQTLQRPDDDILEKGEGTEGEVQLQGWGLLWEEQTIPPLRAVERVWISDSEIVEGETTDWDETKWRDVIRSARNKAIGIRRNPFQGTDERLRE